MKKIKKLDCTSQRNGQKITVHLGAEWIGRFKRGDTEANFLSQKGYAAQAKVEDKGFDVFLIFKGYRYLV